MILLPLLALVLAALGVAWLARPGNRLAAAALPEARSLHQRVTPSGAGLAVVLVLLVADLAIRFILLPGEPRAGLLPHPNLMAALLLVAAISWADDRRPMPAALRLVVHAAAAGLVVRADVLPLSGVGATVFAVVLVVWSINLFNFMDGMDGFAGGMAVIGFATLGGIGLLAGNDAFALAALTVCAAYAGFLAWNFPPARIFLGDVGSAPLGLLAAVFTLWGWHDGLFSPAVPALVFAPFWVDATLTLLRRAARRERLWQAHCTHAYQRLARAGWGHRKTVLWEYLLMAACAAAAGLYHAADAAARPFILGTAGIGFALLVLCVRLLERRVQGSQGSA